MTGAHETSTAFSDEVIKEHTVFELSKQQEMKEMLGRYADGQVEMLQRAMDEWDRVSCSRARRLASRRIECAGNSARVLGSRADARSSPSSSASGWTYSRRVRGGLRTCAASPSRRGAVVLAHQSVEERRYVPAVALRSGSGGMHVVAGLTWRACERAKLRSRRRVCEADDGPGHGAALLPEN